MKKLFLAGNGSRKYAFLWLVFHCGILLYFLLSAVFSREGLKIDSDLFNMLPKNFSGRSIAKADEKLAEFTGRNVFILVSSSDFSEAKNAAETVYGKLKDSPKFKSLFLYSDISSLSEVTDFIFRNRWNLLSEETADFINAPGGERLFAQNALSFAFSPFAVFPLDNLDKDPFMLGEYAFQNYMSAVQSSGTSLFVKDGVLAGKSRGRWYVMIRGTVSKEGAALASKKNAVAQIYSVCSPLEKDGVRFVFSGTPFHSYKSSNSASREITVISAVSFAAVAVILLLVFKSPVPILVSLSSVFLSVAVSFIAAISVFKKIHILTLVFGTSLIGSCIDYSIHFFVNWKANSDLKSGDDVRKLLFSGLTLSFLSTEICFFVLLFAPFSILKQISVFSMTGILSSFLTVTGLYPLIPLPAESRRTEMLPLLCAIPLRRVKKNAGRIAITAFFIFSVTSVFFNYKNLRIENNLSRLYTLEGRVLEDEIEASSVLNYVPSGWFILSGKTEDELLEREEAFCRKLKESAAGNEKDSFGILSTSAFIPSVEKQKKSRSACEKLLLLSEEQFAWLGFDASYAEKLRNDFYSSENEFIQIGKNVPDFLISSVSSVWLGEIDGAFYSVVIPSRVPDEKLFERFSAEDESVFFVNKMKDISRDLDSLTSMILKLFAAAYAVLFVLLKFFYTWKQVLKIISVPLLIILMVSAIFGIAGIHLEFFSITGMILVFGLGLDYIIYMIENERRTKQTENSVLEPFAIFLSFVTTSVSFGALALSSFMPVHLIGLSVFIGLTTAWLCSVFYSRNDDAKQS